MSFTIQFDEVLNAAPPCPAGQAAPQTGNREKRGLANKPKPVVAGPDVEELSRTDYPSADSETSASVPRVIALRWSENAFTAQEERVVASGKF